MHTHYNEDKALIIKQDDSRDALIVFEKNDRLIIQVGTQSLNGMNESILTRKEEAELRKFLNDRAASLEPNTLVETTLSAVEVGEKFWVYRSDYTHNRDNTWKTKAPKDHFKFRGTDSNEREWFAESDMPVFIEARGV